MRHLELTEAQVAAMDAEIDKSRAGRVANPVAPIDPKDRREVEADVLRGRDRNPEVWSRAMELRGFVWYTPDRLNREIGLQALTSADGTSWTHRMHDEGQWRDAQRKMAFTIKELCGSFQEPENFARWIDRWDLQQRAQRAGIKLATR